MGKTLLEKIFESHSGREVFPGDIVDVKIDARLARDFGGANVVNNLEENNLSIDDPNRTFFTFDCNPGGSDQKYAANQQCCRLFARKHDIEIYDINSGIGTHIAIDEGLISPGGVFVSTDSHANIIGAIGAFGQGMGDKDIAYAWAYGKIWFKVPKSMKVILKGELGPDVAAKDIVLALLQKFGANGLLGYAAEFYGPVVEQLSLSQRITIASMATEMGGIISLFPPNQTVLEYCSSVAKQEFEPVFADEDACYEQIVELDVSQLRPLISRPGHPEDVVEVEAVQGTKVDSCFIGSCTNGRFEDLQAAAEILKGKQVAPGVVLKIVPSTDRIWERCLSDGLLNIYKQAGALVGNAGCAGCAAGQIGQNGPNEVTISSGNRNYTGKQGKGEVYLASAETVTACAVAGMICDKNNIPSEPTRFSAGQQREAPTSQPAGPKDSQTKPSKLRGRIWYIPKDNIDTDMIFHNRYLAITDIAEMGQYTFDNLAGWEDFAKKVKPGDIVVTGQNFGCGSSRQQAVDCFKSLGVQMIIAKSFGAIYERNAINAGFPIMLADLPELENESELEVDLVSGEIKALASGEMYTGQPLFDVQIEIYQKGGLL